MRWTRYLDECLRLLEDKKEYSTDELLVYLTRVQLICNKGAASTINDLFGDADMRIPVDMYIKTLKAQLDDLEHSIPPELKPNGITSSLSPYQKYILTKGQLPCDSTSSTPPSLSTSAA